MARSHRTPPPEGDRQRAATGDDERKSRNRERRERNRARGQARGRLQRVRARAFLPGAAYKITRRCLDGMFIFTPDDMAEPISNMIGYVLGVACMKFGVSLHAAVWMSNHDHLDVTDNPHCAKLPSFTQYIHAMLARGINALRGREKGTVWDANKPCITLRPPGEEGVEDLVYTLTNPTADGLVKNSRRWPGFTTYGWKFGETRIFRKPDVFFDAKNGALPDEVGLTLVRPECLMKMTDAEADAYLTAQVHIEEKQLQATRRGRRFMGEKKIRRQSWRRRDSNAKGAYTMQPRVAAHNERARKEQLERNAVWDEEYRQAAEDHADPDIPPQECRPYPAGTYLAVRVYGGTVKPVGADVRERMERLAAAGYGACAGQARPPP